MSESFKVPFAVPRRQTTVRFVRARRTTRYEHGSCVNLVDGRRVEVEAWIDASRVVAAKIEFK